LLARRASEVFSAAPEKTSLARRANKSVATNDCVDFSIEVRVMGTLGLGLRILPNDSRLPRMTIGLGSKRHFAQQLKGFCAFYRFSARARERNRRSKISPPRELPRVRTIISIELLSAVCPAFEVELRLSDF
jgi:hypothetical protein